MFAYSNENGAYNTQTNLLKNKAFSLKALAGYVSTQALWLTLPHFWSLIPFFMAERDLGLFCH